MDVLIEEPPEPVLTAEEAPSGLSSARLLFGRPPLKSLLRRSGRAAIKESIHLKWKVTARACELQAEGRGKTSQISKLQIVAGELSALDHG